MKILFNQQWMFFKWFKTLRRNFHRLQSASCTVSYCNVWESFVCHGNAGRPPCCALKSPANELICMFAVWCGFTHWAVRFSQPWSLPVLYWPTRLSCFLHIHSAHLWSLWPETSSSVYKTRHHTEQPLTTKTHPDLWHKVSTALSMNEALILNIFWGLDHCVFFWECPFVL